MAGSGELVDPVAAVADGANIPPGPLVVALSGGADSAVCAWAALGETSQVRAVFVDHGFAESASMAAAAAAIATKLGIELDVVAVDVPDGPSPEGQARGARHAALEGALKPGETLLSGHTADDQAETVLGNVLRGSGATGLSGIPAQRSRWSRPLLSIPRAVVRGAADVLGFPYLDDPANLAIGPRRNELRNEVMPDLRRRFNPALDAALLRTARLSQDDDAALETAAARVPLTETRHGVKIPAGSLATAPMAVASRVARLAIRRARGPHGGDFSEVEAVLAAVGGAATTIGSGIQVAREGPFVTLSWPMPPPPDPVRVQVPGETAFWSGIISAHRGTPPWRPVGTSVAILDAGPLELRPADEGDRLAIDGGHKRITAVLAEAGVPVRLRRHWPVVALGGSISWVVGIRRATAQGSGGDKVTLAARLEEQ